MLLNRTSKTYLSNTSSYEYQLLCRGVSVKVHRDQHQVVVGDEWSEEGNERAGRYYQLHTDRRDESYGHRGGSCLPVACPCLLPPPVLWYSGQNAKSNSSQAHYSPTITGECKDSLRPTHVVCGTFVCRSINIPALQHSTIVSISRVLSRVAFGFRRLARQIAFAFAE